ncbi:MAG: hypothetical protein OXU68_05265, partial [Bacteroidota bacterium]|nr:hypothetical protein [Bacteroidota bacterium]
MNVVAEPPQEIVLSTSDLGVDEGATADYTVKLAAQPTTDVTVAITVHSFIAGRSVPAVTTSPTSLTFTAANYNTEQTVTVLAAQDNNAINDRATLVHTASGGDYEGQTASLKVTVDDDDAGIVLSRSEQAVSEGGSSTHRVKLSTQPSGDVTVDITGHVGTDLTLDMESLTFTTVNYNTAQTVTVTAGQDDDAAFDTATLLHTASGGGYAGLTASLPVTTIDDETAEITISESTLGVSEGSSKTYTVKLATPPTVPVTVAITGQAGTDLMLDKTSLTFNPSGSDLWSTAQTVTVTAGQDDDAADDLVTLVHTASGGEYSEITASLPVTVDDDETARIVLSASTLRVDEGSNNTYTVKLATQPTADVTVRISGHSGTDLSLDVESLIFTTANYNTAQTVMVSAGSDSDADDDLVALEHRARGGDYQNLRSTIDVTVNDVTKAIVVNPMDLPVDEGSDASFSVRLPGQPSGDVTVTITGHSGTDLTLDVESLTFTTTNYSMARTVTVTAGRDNDIDDEEVTLTLTAAGGGYMGLTAEVDVTVDDNTPGLRVSKTELTVPEGGCNADNSDPPDFETFELSLTERPGTKRDPTRVKVTLSAEQGKPIAVFSWPRNRSQSRVFEFPRSSPPWPQPETFSLCAVEDDNTDYETVILTLDPSGGGGYDNAASVDITLNVIDNDATRGLVFDPDPLSINEGTSADYMVKLGTPPTAGVAVAITSSSTDVTTSPTSLTFTTGNWKEAQPVTVTAASDANTNNETEMLTHTATSTDTDYTRTDNLSVMVVDASVLLDVSATTLMVDEGDQVTFDVRLPVQPATNVKVTITSTSRDLTTGPRLLTFTTTNYNLKQSVTVTAKADDDFDDETETLTLTAAGGAYEGKTAEVAVTINDVSTGIVVVPTDLTLDEGSNNSFEVSLAAQPSGDVMVTITGHSGTDLTLTPDPAELTFTTSTWNTAQTVTVSARADADIDDDEVKLTLTAAGADYTDVTAEVDVTIEDSTPGLRVSETELTLQEGGCVPPYDVHTFELSLSVQPTHRNGVKAVIIHDDTHFRVASRSRQGNSINFPRGRNWDRAALVGLCAEEDDDAYNEVLTLTLDPSGGNYNTAQSETITVNLIDDDTAEIVLSESTLGVDEGDDESYTVKLATQPTATVTVAITSSNTDVTTSPTSLTFTTADYNTAQTVTVSAGDDADATNDTATLTHTASGGDYASETASLAVTVDDDDTAVGIVLSASDLEVYEGSNNTYTVKLASQPTGAVTVDITGLTGTDLTVSNNPTRFTTANWNILQTVTVFAGEDGDATNDTATLVHTASGGETANLTVTTIDDEAAGCPVAIVPPIEVTEGGCTKFPLIEIRPFMDPTVPVMMAIASDNPDVTTSPTSVIFTPATQLTRQMLTINAAADTDSDDDMATLTITASGGGLSGLTGMVEVIVRDNTPRIVLSASTLAVNEGADKTYTVKLATQPTAAVTVAITGHSGTNLTLDKSSLTFNPSGSDLWSTAQTV